jgi:hypothetical protein
VALISDKRKQNIDLREKYGVINDGKTSTTWKK